MAGNTLSNENCLGFAAHDSKGHLVPWKFTRREGELDYIVAN